MTGIELVSWGDQLEALPTTGRHLTAAYTADTVVLFDGSTASSTRWRRLYTSFTDAGAGGGAVRGVRLAREIFDALLRQAVHAVYPDGLYPSRQSWRLATRHAQVLLEWSPVPAPDGSVVGREAARLELRDHAVRQVTGAILAVEDLSALRADGPGALVPAERPYPLADAILHDWLTRTGAS